MDEKELFLQAQKGDKEAREALFEKNAGLIHHVIKRYTGRGYETEDLFQLGAIGLLKAIEKFDTEYGVCFSTYAVPMIAGEVRRFMRDDGMVKVSRGIKENIWKLNRTREELHNRLGREVTLKELSQASGVPMEDVVLAIDAGREVESIYRTVYQSDGNEIYLLDMIKEGQQAGHGYTMQDEGEGVLDRMLLEQLMNQLDKRERMLIRMRFYENKTQVQVAQSLGMSQVQVSRLEKKVLIRMRECMN